MMPAWPQGLKKQMLLQKPYQMAISDKMGDQKPLASMGLPIPRGRPMKRYEALADQLANDIRAGRLAPGTRLPSIRTLTARHGVSPSTAFQAYYRLEDRGLVRARERSGYFVAGTGGPALPQPARPGAPRLRASVDVSDLVFSVLDAARDRGIVPLGSAFPAPELFPQQRLARSLGRAARQAGPWDPLSDLPQGHAGLRQQIAQRYLGLGMRLAADDIVVTNGALEALNLALSAVAQPGDLVAVESPGFYAGLQALERLRMRALEIPVHPGGGLDLAALAEALRQHPVRACWFMTSFQNPTGASLDEARKKELVALLSAHDVPLIEDDVYGELYFGARAPRPAKAYDRKGLVMHCSSFSKTLAPGWRVGWIAPGRYAERVQRLRLTTTLAASLPAQAGLADYLQHGGYDRHLRRLRHALEAQQASLLASIGRHFPPGVRVSRPEGGYFLWVELPRGTDTLALHREAAARGISIAPGPMFSARRAFANGLRLNYGWPWDARMEGAMRTLGSLLR
jgi:DNA-binding transcriptional MocR family regulator